MFCNMNITSTYNNKYFQDDYYYNKIILKTLPMNRIIFVKYIYLDFIEAGRFLARNIIRYNEKSPY